MLVVSLRLFHLVSLDEPLFLQPALLDAFEAPLHAFARGADGFAADRYEDRVRVRAGENPHRDPAALLDVHLELHVLCLAVRDDVFPADGDAVHEDLDGHFALGAEAGALDVPVRFLVDAERLHFDVSLFVEAGGDPGFDFHFARLGELHFAAFLADFATVDLEFHEMTLAVADVVAAESNAFAPGVILELAIELHVAATEADLLAVDAGEVGLAADARAESGVERVIPDVQLPGVRRVDGGHEIDGRHELAIRAGNLVSDVHDVFIRADAVELRQAVVREL